jgi:dihydrodipicolinate synthase/N-acetylneuraminate lyase
MSTALPCDWSGVYPAATTQFDSDLEVDLPATQRRFCRTAYTAWC